MKTLKLKLDLDRLAVESFDTAALPAARRGTVRGHVCSDACTVSICNPTCGIMPASANSACEAMARTPFCGDTNDITGCQPCCV